MCENLTYACKFRKICALSFLPAGNPWYVLPILTDHQGIIRAQEAAKSVDKSEDLPKTGPNDLRMLPSCDIISRSRDDQAVRTHCEVNPNFPFRIAERYPLDVRGVASRPLQETQRVGHAP